MFCILLSICIHETFRRKERTKRNTKRSSASGSWLKRKNPSGGGSHQELEHISLGTHILIPDYWGGGEAAGKKESGREGGREAERERSARDRDDASEKREDGEDEKMRRKRLGGKTKKPVCWFALFLFFFLWRHTSPSFIVSFSLFFFLSHPQHQTASLGMTAKEH